MAAVTGVIHAAFAVRIMELPMKQAVQCCIKGAHAPSCLAGVGRKVALV